MSLVVSFAGQIGSGKSSVSQALAYRLGWPRAAFGDYLRKLAKERGLDPGNREVLQDLGQSLVEQDARAFCRAVISDGGFSANSHMLIDGVRHVEIQREIARIVVPSASKLIYLSAGSSERLSRIHERRNGTKDFPRAEAHVVESELRGELPDIADAIIDAEQELTLVVEQCNARIGNWLSALN